MTAYTELLLNPITIIAALLALFFVVMAVRRSRHASRSSVRLKDGVPDKPYHIANPYTLPPLPTPPDTAPALRDTLTAPRSPASSPRVFRQFNQSAEHPDMNLPNDQVRYVWE
ncbi:MAG: hypothetical protein RBS84_03065 [Kiritimatiellia bacterium]|jgi:hypothetical protein|nr:hypothetical protein [Kiritimatiellia bacterium]